jgi:hypothetical protein
VPNALAVALTGWGVGRRVVVVIDRERRHQPGSLTHHLRNGGIVEIEAVLDGIASALERAMQPFAAVRVTGNFFLPAMGLIDDGLQLLDGQRRLRNEVALLVDPRAMGHVDLEPIGAVIELLAGRLARLDRTVDQLRPFRHFDLRSVTLEVVAAGGGDGACDHEHSRSRDASLIDGHLDSDVAIPGTLGLHVAEGGEALLQRASYGHRCARGAIGDGIFQQLNVVAPLGRIFALQKDVGVRVDHAGKNGHVRQIDHPRTGGCGDIAADALDAIAADDDGLIAADIR